MVAVYITAAVLAWFGCGLLAVYLDAAEWGASDDASPPLAMLSGLAGLLVVLAFVVFDAGARRHREGK